MKQAVLLTALMFLVIANYCHAQFTIVGNIQHLDNQMVYLRYMNDSLSQQTDSVYAWDGRFVMRGYIAEPTKANLRSQDGMLDYDFFFEPGNTILTGDLKVSGDNYMVRGGNTTKAFAGYIAADKPYMTLRDSLMSASYQLRQNGDTTTALHTYNAFTEAAIASKKLEKDFITTHPQSPVSAFLLHFLYSQRGTWEKGDSLMELLADDALASKYIRAREKTINKLRKLEPGKPMIPFSQKDKDGNRFYSASLKGKHYLIEFWASWCAPCRKENPALRKVYQKYHPKGFEVVGISLDDNRSKWLDAIVKDQLPWIHVSDLKGWKNAVAQLYEVIMIPSNFLIDKKGTIIGHSLRADELSKKLAQIYTK